MATRKSSISGISSRRSACDKCRVSKARCLRANPDQARCDRCSRIDSECITSPIFRLRSWQPPAAGNDMPDMLNSTNEPHKRQRRNSQPQQQPTPRESSTCLDANLLSAGEIHPYISDISTYQSLDWKKQSRVPDPPNVLYGDETRTQMDTTFGHVESDFDINLSENFFATTPPASSGAEPITPLASLPSLSTELVSGFATQFSQDFSPQTSDNNALRCNGKALVDTKQTPLQRLSKLDYDLITFLIRLDREPPRVILKTLFEGQGNPSSPTVVDDILNSTTEYLIILKLLNSCYLQSSGSPSVDASNDSRHSSHGSRRSSISSIYSDHDSTADSPHQSQPLASTPPSYHDLDTPSLLLVLSVYIHLLRLHLIVFTNIYGCLRELSESENPQLRPILRLSISALPIESGNLQTLVLIQTVTSLLERIGVLLGLPQEFRISRRRGEERGLLSAPGFLSLTKLALEKEDAGTGLNGKGGMKALRKNIAKAKQLLRERIDP
ncbi:uncharacterized protein F4807DRAFT_467707 [Annulohypoxylon truncatum]|uniref:uncharacterized protein n=1 Tax=Annulohypoxylon truncatum TaxID=327061 RepID=UPI002007C3AC|nr:uncharacterized protein F4807DRAFT_467707 [Annulohypoxylon truncatum]KAI1209520.1 hypothetical protein F4807DRAFT_467707 [Annulohypoxylon truncatum]